VNRDDRVCQARADPAVSQDGRVLTRLINQCHESTQLRGLLLFRLPPDCIADVTEELPVFFEECVEPAPRLCILASPRHNPFHYAVLIDPIAVDAIVSLVAQLRDGIGSSEQQVTEGDFCLLSCLRIIEVLVQEV